MKEIHTDNYLEVRFVRKRVHPRWYHAGLDHPPTKKPCKTLNAVYIMSWAGLDGK